jgi:ribosomal protein L3 glutamine methyltransferase
VSGALKLPRERLEWFLDASLTESERRRLAELVERRAVDKVPTAYLLNEAWLGPFRFYVDERVIVPRSFLAELLEERFLPWIEQPERIQRVLDLCTGSGCLAIVAAYAFPQAEIVAADFSDEALEVARINVEAYGLQDRVRLLHSDVFSGLAGESFDLIVSNPPYVTAQAMAELPPEYRHEPALALAAGEDGLDVVRRILAEAKRHLTPQGWLAVEVGHNRALVEAAFPELPFTWLATETAEDKVFLLPASAL